MYRKVKMGSIFWDQGGIEPAAIFNSHRNIAQALTTEPFLPL